MPNSSNLPLATPPAPDAAGAASTFLATAPPAKLNQLHMLCLVAARNLIVAGEELAGCGDGPALAPWTGAFATEPFPEAPDGEVLYDSVEFAGEAALYRLLNADPDLEILLTGALVWQLRGIDAIARRRTDGVFLLCEAKGTSRPLAAPLSYLPETRRRGRQLSWRWCWNALLDMAEHPATAAAFLVLLQPLLEGRVERLLTLSRATRQDGAWRIAETRNYREAQLRTYAPLAQTYPLTRQRAMFAEMIATPSGKVLFDAAAGFFRLEPLPASDKIVFNKRRSAS